MANGTSSIFSGLSAALSALTPGQLTLLGGHLTASDEAKAMSYLASMQVNPAMAGNFLGLLGNVKNIPPQVVTYATSALGLGIVTPAGLAAMTSAQAELQKALASETSLQQAFGV